MEVPRGREGVRRRNNRLVKETRGPVLDRPSRFRHNLRLWRLLTLHLDQPSSVASRSPRSSSGPSGPFSRPCIGYWLIKNAVESPDRFLEVTLIGITNGSIYALVALGYTLVYGIIELINFAHGDNFMLGTFQTNVIVNAGSFQIPFFPTSFVLAIPLGAAATANSSSGQKIYTILACLFFSMLFCMVINVSIERIGYKPLRDQPRLVPLITALGFSFILQDVGLIWKGAGPQPLPNILPTGTIFHWRGATYAWDDFIVIAVTIPLLDRAHLSRAAYALGEGDARDRAGHGRLLDDGHQRRSHDLVHLRARRRARRRRRRDLRPLHRHDEVRPRLPPRPLRVHGGRARRDRQPERGSARGNRARD